MTASYSASGRAFNFSYNQYAAGERYGSNFKKRADLGMYFVGSPRDNKIRPALFDRSNRSATPRSPRLNRTALSASSFGRPNAPPGPA